MRPRRGGGGSGSSSSDGGLSTLTLPTGDDLYSLPPPPKSGTIWGDTLDLSASLVGGAAAGGGMQRSLTRLSSASGGSARQMTRTRSGTVRDSLPGIARSQFNVHYMPEALHQVKKHKFLPIYWVYKSYLQR